MTQRSLLHTVRSEMHGKPNLPLLIIIGLLTLSGLLILATVSASSSLERTGSSFFYLNHQILVGLIPGIIFGTIAFFTPLSLFRKWSFFLLLGNIILLILVFVPGIGSVHAEANRWISIAGITFQPSEILKLTSILYIASWLSARNYKSKHSGKQSQKLLAFLLGTPDDFRRIFLPFLLTALIISILLILQPDISTLGVILATMLAMYFVAGTPIRHSLALLAAAPIILLALIKIAPYRMSRWTVFLDPSTDPLGQGYQIKQALIGIGSGGLTGIGLGLGFQSRLPEQMGDSIFAVFAEKTGFIGATLLVLLLLVFIWQSFALARKSNDDFSKLVAIGIPTWIAVQSFINIGSMLQLVPLTGIPLPFVSYGGSALAAELIAMGILLNISKHTQNTR